MKEFWKRVSLERRYRKLGALDADETFAKTCITITKWELIPNPMPTHPGAVIGIHDGGAAKWCEALYKATENGFILKVISMAPGNATCWVCDQLMFNWLKERGV